MKGVWKEFTKGLVISNPLFVLVLGNCPALMMTMALDSSIGMAIGLAFVMFWSSMIISAMRKVIPNMVRIPVYIVIVASFVTMVDMAFHAYVPSIYTLLGIYLPLITVNCIVLGRMEVFASRNTVVLSVADSVGMAFGFGLAMLVIAIPRVLLGTGALTVAGNTLFTLPGLKDNPIGLLVLPPGAFLVIGLLHSLFRRLGVEKNE